LTHEQAVVARCTLDGQTRWSHVAQQLGLSQHDARSKLDPSYMHWATKTTLRPEPIIDFAESHDLTSPHIKHPMRDKIIARLKRGSATAETIANAIGHPIRNVSACMSRMVAQGDIQRTGNRPGTWSLTSQEQAA
jgi:predicted ArsR family transcriptional regulator